MRDANELSTIKRKLRVLVGCEESGTVRDAFIRAGHNAISCDLVPSRSDLGEHYQCDIFEAMRMGCWDIIILHPDCTKLAVSGNGTYGLGKPGYEARIAATLWTEQLYHIARLMAKVGICLENPVGVLSSKSALGKPTQYIQPWQFGHGETKKTGLWLDRLPPLVPTNIVDGREQRCWKMAPSPHEKEIEALRTKVLPKQWLVSGEHYNE